MDTEVFQRLAADPAYAAGVEWGSARLGHPEGKIRNHILQLERNLEAIAELIPPADQARLKLLIHTHDTFKYRAGEEVPVSDPKSHAGLAAEFLSKFTSDGDVLAVARYHDSPFASWCDWVYRGDTSLKDFKEALAGVRNHDLLFTFMLLDGITEGKHMAPLEWALDIFKREGALQRDYSALMDRLRPNSRDHREQTEAVPPLRQERQFNGMPYRALGPIETWGADIYIPVSDLPKLRPVLQDLATATGRRYAGVVTEEEGNIHLHLSRYPRRATQNVPSVEECRAGMRDVIGAFERTDIRVLGASEAEPSAAPGLQRATIGLVEGYGETRKRALVKLLDEGAYASLADAITAVTSQLGDLGPDVRGAASLKELSARLSALNLACAHSASETITIAGSAVTVQFGDILSVAPGNYLYEEPCAIITGIGRPARTAAFNLAVAFKQARFTFESLAARETVNIELPQFCETPAATMV